MSSIRKSYLDKKINKLAASKYQSDKKLSKFLISPRLYYKSDQKILKEFNFNDDKNENQNINGKDENPELKELKRNLFNKENYCPNENSLKSQASQNTREDSLKSLIKEKSKPKPQMYIFRSSIKILDNFNNQNNLRKSQPPSALKSRNNIAFNTMNNDIENFIHSTIGNVEKKSENNSDNENENFIIETEEQKYLKEVKNKKLIKNGFTKGALAIIQMEQLHAENSIKNNFYITYVNNEKNKKNICFRIGNSNMCTCGHSFVKHSKYEYKLKCRKCNCKNFQYIPLFPEETDKYKDAYLLDFEYDNWKAGCECKHNWTEHDFKKNGKCLKCDCECFVSDFNCGVCGKAWEEHEILYETKDERIKSGESWGDNYKPFSKKQLEELYSM